MSLIGQNNKPSNSLTPFVKGSVIEHCSVLVTLEENIVSYNLYVWVYCQKT